jgi:hypothetical protein
MDNLTNTNSDTEHRIIYEDEVCIITEHVNYIKVFFIKERIYIEDLDFSYIIKENTNNGELDKLLIFDCINITYTDDEALFCGILKININDPKNIILCNLKPYLRKIVGMFKFDRVLSVYSTFEEAVEYIKTRS